MLQRLDQALERRQLALCAPVAAARRLAALLDAPLDELQIAEHELHLHEIDVGARIHRVAHVDDVRVGERADDMRHGFDTADVRQKAIAQPLAAAGALRQSSDVDDVDGGVDLPRRLEDLVQAVQPWVGDRHHTEVRLGGGVRVRRRGGVAMGECVEQGGLAHVGQADDSELHGRFSSSLVSMTSSRRERSDSCLRTLPG